jgi:hypothetical protein
MTRPRVTVGFPVYNGEQFLSQALDSLLAQDYGDFEILISDNASTDSTRAICDQYARRDSRVRVLGSDANRGAAWNFNRVAAEAQSPYFMWAAHDDLWSGDCISRYVECLEERRDAVLVYGHYLAINAAGKQVGEPYRNFANDGETRRERLARILSHWEIHHVIYGLFRTAALQRTRHVLSCVGSEIILLSEIALLGKTLELDHICSQRRGPDVDESYRSRQEQLTYLDTRLRVRGAPRLVRLTIAREVVRSIVRAELPAGETAQLVHDTMGIYFTRLALVDLKEFASQEFASHPRTLALLRRVAREAAFRRRPPGSRRSTSRDEDR